MKLVFVYDGSSGSAATMISTIESLKIFDVVRAFNTGNMTTLENITNNSNEADTLVLFHALDANDNLKSIVIELLKLGYAVCSNITTYTQSNLNILYSLSLLTSVPNEQNSSEAGFTTVENTVLNNTLATTSGKSIQIRIQDGTALFTEISLNSVSSDYVHVGFTTQKSMSSFGFWPKGSIVNGSAINGVLINAGILLFNSTKPQGSDLNNFLKDLAEFCIHKGLSKKYKIIGTVSNSKQEFLSRKIRAYNKASGTLLAETISSEAGSYSLELRTADPVYVVCIHDDSDTNNSQIKDDILPILID